MVARSGSAGSASALFDRVLAGSDKADPQPFALLHRPTASGRDRIEVLVGEVTAVDRLDDLPLAARAARPGPELLALIPYRQVRERGFECRDDGEPIIAMRVTEHASEPLDAVLERLPDREVSLAGSGFDLSDNRYAEIVRTVIAEEIGRGEGSNFVVRRTFTGHIPGWSAATALTLFRRLLVSESGTYWAFLVYAGGRTFVGATPEQHLSLNGGIAAMNPVSGTYRYPDGGPSLHGLLEFLHDRKETEELYMVLDEELKMMARICDTGGQVRGPYLKEMARLAHTEYLIEGRSSLDVRELISATMFAPTVTGSPIENACRVLARREPSGRGFYSGVIALAGWDVARMRQLDSAILIRAADIDAQGRFSLGVGATLVRHSVPESEVAETRAKAAAVLAAAGLGGRPGNAGPVPGGHAGPVPGGPGSLARHRAVRASLVRRNSGLASFWFEPLGMRGRSHPALHGRDILVVDAEDAFTSMLAHQLRAIGPRVLVVSWDRLRKRPDLADRGDFVILGPGPGDPDDPDDLRIATMRMLATRLFRSGAPFVAVCLSHQVLARVLGLPVVRKQAPSQGQQREIDLFGDHRLVGFYNTFAAIAANDRLPDPRTGGLVRVSRDGLTGEVHAMRGAGFASVQFHPESVLTQHGPEILAGLLGWVTDSGRTAAA